jgi:hypothetical protein
MVLLQLFKFIATRITAAKTAAATSHDATLIPTEMADATCAVISKSGSSVSDSRADSRRVCLALLGFGGHEFVIPSRAKIPLPFVAAGQQQTGRHAVHVVALRVLRIGHLRCPPLAVQSGGVDHCGSYLEKNGTAISSAIPPHTIR